jgi:prevent-host-death family protein
LAGSTVVDSPATLPVHGVPRFAVATEGVTPMPKTIPAADAPERLSELLGWVERGDEVILERHGEPAFVIVPPGIYAELLGLREAQRRATDLAELRRLRERVRARNQDLTDEQANEWADRFVAEAFEGLIASGSVRLAPRHVEDPDASDGDGAP